MDGPPGVVSCEIAPGESFTYDFMVSPVRTFKIHISDSEPRLINLVHTGTTAIRYE